MPKQSTVTPPSYDNLHAWLKVLHRLARAEANASDEDTFTTEPLSQDIAECVAWGWVKTVQAETSDDRQMAFVPRPAPGQTRLVLLPAGRAVYERMSQYFEEQGGLIPA